MANPTQPKRLRFRDEDSFICKNRGGRKKTYKLYIGAAGEVQRVEIASDVLPADSQDGPTLNPPALPAYDMPPTPIIPADSPVDGPVLNPPILPDLPPKDTQTVLVSFPDWGSLSCDAIKNGILDLQNTLMTSKFSDPAIRAEYENQVQLGKNMYERKCGAQQPPTDTIGGIKTPVTPIIPVTPAGVGIISGGGFGAPSGSGAGGAEKKDKKPFPWLWIVVGGAALYFLTKGKN